MTSLQIFRSLDIWLLFKEGKRRFRERGDHLLLVLINNPFALLYSWKPLEIFITFSLYRTDGGINTSIWCFYLGFFKMVYKSSSTFLYISLATAVTNTSNIGGLAASLVGSDNNFSTAQSMKSYFCPLISKNRFNKTHQIYCSDLIICTFILIFLRVVILQCYLSWAMCNTSEVKPLAMVD